MGAAFGCSAKVVDVEVRGAVALNRTVARGTTIPSTSVQIIRAAEVCTSNDTDLRIVGASRIVHEVFAITGLADMFVFEP